ncbi:hypothetical protein FB45DRAFT_1054189 [Roridomyces roridus]|uniref:Uncharacterized protein n=1 Tax=Roridomyces roridus TaxID=1738132 RepID=A0AAD7C845_9AGAR|nr:hypothetical protein FB45DRAFT_1054189 [Roridomyces roridus]
MSAPAATTQKPLLLPGIAPHLFQTRRPPHRRRKMVVLPQGSKTDPTSPSTSGSESVQREPSDGSSTATAVDDGQPAANVNPTLTPEVVDEIVVRVVDALRPELVVHVVDALRPELQGMFTSLEARVAAQPPPTEPPVSVFWWMFAAFLWVVFAIAELFTWS